MKGFIRGRENERVTVVRMSPDRWEVRNVEWTTRREMANTVMLVLTGLGAAGLLWYLAGVFYGK